MARRVLKPHPYPGIGAKIRDARLAAGLCARELGEMLGGSNKGLISLWERELCCPSEAKMDLIEKALGIELPRATRNASGRRSDGERACLTCGKMFTGFYRKKYCSPACWYATMPPKKRTCPVCSKEFEPGTQGQRFCSRQCSGYGQRSERRRPHCERCGGEMPITAPPDQRFCSRLCSRRARLGRDELYETGDTRPNTLGYIEIKTEDGWKLQHRVVMEEHLGHPLLPGQNVHHKNRIKTDNQIENLELWYTPQPAGGRVVDMIQRWHDSGVLLGLTEHQLVALRAEYERDLILDKGATREKPYDPADDAKDVTLEPSSEQQRLLL